MYFYRYINRAEVVFAGTFNNQIGGGHDALLRSETESKLRTQWGVTQWGYAVTDSLRRSLVGIVGHGSGEPLL